MSPLKIILLLRIYADFTPNYSEPEAYAFSPSMQMAVEDFKARGLIYPSTTLEMLRKGGPHKVLTAEGKKLVERLMAVEPEETK